MWKPKTKNKEFPTRMPPMEEQQSEIQYPGWHKDATGKRLWIGKDKRKEKIMTYSHRWLWF